MAEPTKVRAKEKLTGNIVYVYPHELDLYPKLLEAAPSSKSKSSSNSTTKDGK